jgi:hypothetical protein
MVLDTIKISLSLAGAGVISMMTGMICFSSLSIYLFALLVTILGFGFYFIGLKYLWKFNNFDNIVISGALAVIFNPAWLHLVGII